MSMLEHVYWESVLMFHIFSSAQVIGNLVCTTRRKATLNNAYIQSAWDYYLMNSKLSHPCYYKWAQLCQSLFQINTNVEH